MKNLFTKPQIIQQTQSTEYYSANLIGHNSRPSSQTQKQTPQTAPKMLSVKFQNQGTEDHHHKTPQHKEIYLNLSSYRSNIIQVRKSLETIEYYRNQREKLIQTTKAQQQKPTKNTKPFMSSFNDKAFKMVNQLFPSSTCVPQVVSNDMNGFINNLNQTIFQQSDLKRQQNESGRSTTKLQKKASPSSQHSTCINSTQDFNPLIMSPRDSGSVQGWLQMDVISRNEKWSKMKDQKLHDNRQESIKKELEPCTFTPKLNYVSPKNYSLQQSLYHKSSATITSSPEANKFQSTNHTKNPSRARQSEQSFSRSMRQVTTYEELSNFKRVKASNDGFLGIKDVINFRRVGQL